MLHALKSLLLRGVQGFADVEHIIGIATDSRSIPSSVVGKYFFTRKSLIIALTLRGLEWRLVKFRTPPTQFGVYLRK